MTTSWEAERTSSRLFAAPSSTEVSIDGDALTVRRGGVVVQKFELGASSVEVTRHQWNLDDGTAVKIRSENDGVCIGGRGAFFPDLPYENSVVDRPDLVMAGPAFEELHGALVRALPERLPADSGIATNRFLLWKLGEDSWPSALVPFGVIILGGALTQLPGPFAFHVALAVLMVAGAIWLIAKSDRAAKLPALALTIERDLVTVIRLRPATSTLVSGSLASGKIDHGRCSPKLGALDVPMVRVSLGSGPGRPLTIGSPRSWVGTRGPRMRGPDYIMAPAWWPTFIEAVTRAARAPN